MCDDAKLPKCSCAKAVNTANCIQNRVISQGTKDISYEIMFGEILKFKDLHRFDELNKSLSIQVLKLLKVLH